MNQKINLKFFFIIFTVLLFSPNFAYAEDKKVNAIEDQLQIITQDLKTLEKAVYKSSDITSNALPTNGLNEEILTRHLLKLNEIEEQFRLLTNRFEEVNFKLDKLSNRVTKIQSDSQLRFSDLETGESTNIVKTNKTKKPKALIANTVKGKGFSFSENNNDWHHAVLTKSLYEQGLKELE